MIILINVIAIFFCLSLQLIANMTALAWRPEWQSLLANGTVNNPELNNLTGIVYGELYTRGYVVWAAADYDCRR